MLRWLTGGRPMKCLGYAFTDPIANLPVFYWIDKYDRVWLAHGRWSAFRVAPTGKVTMKLLEVLNERRSS